MMNAMRLWLLLVAVLVFTGCDKETESKPKEEKTQAQQPDKETYLLFVRIPDPVMPLERSEKYEDPLNSFLIDKGLGEVSGGGSMLSEPDAAGKRSIAWVGLDLDVYDPDKAMPELVKKLKEMGVPNGTEIEQSQPVERTIKVN